MKSGYSIDMQGKVVVITGGTSGIGKVAALKLAQIGARLVIVARDRTRGEATLEQLRQIRPDVRHAVHYADLSVLAEMKRVAQDIAAAEPRIDVLINNAGAIFQRRELTPDGLERTFATNHVSYFVMTHFLRDRLIASAPARVVNTSSDAHRSGKLNFEDLQAERSYSGFAVYGRSKLCNILFTRELSRRLAGTGVTANCLHPGFVATRFGDDAGGPLAAMFRVAKKTFAIAPEAGADTMVFLASSPGVANVSGEYFYKRRPKTPTQDARDDAAAKRLWDETARLL
jgi:NAD(P)-dependent dehydrogenase (short-subunit alcohol dehydrogenase family)